MMEIRRMIDNGELSIDALKWKVRRDSFFDTGSSTAASANKTPNKYMKLEDPYFDFPTDPAE
jgi:hypothetical protein